mgnify:CR=1 FL=1
MLTNNFDSASKTVRKPFADSMIFNGIITFRVLWTKKDGEK